MTQNRSTAERDAKLALLVALMALSAATRKPRPWHEKGIIGDLTWPLR